MEMRRMIPAVLAVLVVVGAHPRAGGALPAKATRHIPTMTQFMSFAFPEELIAARKADRIAWVSNDRGLRNVYTAVAPAFTPVRVTSFMKDNGIETTQL